jgi:hypothetical protein
MGEIATLRRAVSWVLRLDDAGREWLAAWLLNTTQENLRSLRLQPRKAGSTNG